MSQNSIEYNNRSKSWIIYASKITSNPNFHSSDYADISNLILNAESGNIDIHTPNGTTLFNNDVSFISSAYINTLKLSNDVSENFQGNIHLTGNLKVGGIIEQDSGFTGLLGNTAINDLSCNSLNVRGSNANNLEIISIKEINGTVKLLFY